MKVHAHNCSEFLHQVTFLFWAKRDLKRAQNEVFQGIIKSQLKLQHEVTAAQGLKLKQIIFFEMSLF